MLNSVPLHPMKSTAVMLPGESMKLPLEASLRNLILESGGVFGQLLQARSGEMLQTVPIIRLCRTNRLSGPKSIAEVTCIGRGQLQLPLRPSDGPGHRSCASIRPLSDGNLETMSCMNDIRRLYHSCHALATRLDPPGRSVHATDSQVARLFDAPLEALLRARRHSLAAATREDWYGAGSVSASRSRERALVLHGVCSPLPIDEAGHRDAGCIRGLWSRSDGEMQIQILSFAVGKVLSPDDRLASLLMLSTHARMLRAVRRLKALECRLAAEVSLQAWVDGHRVGAVAEGDDIAGTAT